MPETKHVTAVNTETITLGTRERADAWRATCACGWTGTPCLRPKIAENEARVHVKQAERDVMNEQPITHV